MTAPTIDFAKMDGLAPGIVQDARTGQVLMLGFLNEESWRRTKETGTCELTSKKQHSESSGANRSSWARNAIFRKQSKDSGT